MVKLGDVFGIKTNKGTGYLQYTHTEPVMGDIIRVFLGEFNKTENEIQELIKKYTNYFVYFHVKGFVRRKNIFKIGNFEIPEHSQKFPVFRISRELVPKNRTRANWWLWDGEKKDEVDYLSEEQLKYPIKCAVGPLNIVDDLENNVRPEDRIW